MIDSFDYSQDAVTNSAAAVGDESDADEHGSNGDDDDNSNGSDDVGDDSFDYDVNHFNDPVANDDGSDRAPELVTAPDDYVAVQIDGIDCDANNVNVVDTHDEEDVDNMTTENVANVMASAEIDERQSAIGEARCVTYIFKV
jgi:hypothetical protein